MICLICRETEIAERLISIRFERGEIKLIVRGVPAHVCPICGESYVDENVAVRLLQNADQASKAGILDDVIEYNSLT